MQFTIKENAEPITSPKGARYSKATVLNENNNEYTNVTLFAPFCDKKVGETITGQMTPNDFNGKKGWKFLEEKTNTLYPKKDNNIAKAMEKKGAMIEVAQERKADAIKLAGTARDATLLTVAMLQHNPTAGLLSTEDIKALWQKWRSWLMTEFDQQPPF